MIIALLIYFGINLFIAGMAVDVHFNTRKENIQCASILLFFGTILIVWEFTLAKWYENSSLRFYIEFYFTKKYYNLEPEILKYIENTISVEKELKDRKSKKLVKHLTKILKRNATKKTS